MADHVPKKTLAALDARDAEHGRACVMTGTRTDRIIPQHRQGGMGGRKDKHRLPNLLWLDSLINGWLESDAEWAAIALAWGVKVPLWVKDVTAVPVYFPTELRWFVLEGNTRREVRTVEAADMMIKVYGNDYLLWKAVADGTDRAFTLYMRAVS